MKDPKQINIIGPYPPPYGGISVHIKRIYDHIHDQNVRFYDTDPRSNKDLPQKVIKLNRWKLIRLLFKFKKIIHYHSSSIKVRLFLSFLALINPNIYIHIHGASLVDQLEAKNWKGILFRSLLRRVNLISSNSEIARYIESRLQVKSHHQYDAFIPPVYDQKTVDQVLTSIEWPTSKYVISMTGWFTLYKSQDLYGFDLMLNALHKLHSKGLDASVIASINGIKQRDLYESFLKERDALSLNNHFQLIMQDLPELYPILMKSDLFVRPTNTDGNAVSIKEALWFDTPALASDVAPRPEKVVTFKNRDANDFAHKIESILKRKTVRTKSFLNPEKKFKHPMIGKIYGFNE